MTPKIIGTKSNESGFSVSFPNGFDGEPKIELNGLDIDCDGGCMIYGALSACSNWIESYIEDMKSKPQAVYDTYDFVNEDGTVDNVTLKEGKVIKKD